MTLGFELTDGRLGEEPRPKLVVADAVGDRLDVVKGNGVEAFSRLATHAPITPTVLEEEIGGRDD